MSDTNTTKMLQAIINGQSALKQELIGRIEKVDDKVGRLEEKVDEGFKETNKCFEEVTERLDNLGSDLAQLSDDAPTNKEFDNHEKRIATLENQLTKN